MHQRTHEIIMTELTKTNAELARHSEEEENFRAALFGNGGVGMAEEIRILKRGYRAILWLGGITTSAVVVQAAIALRESII